MDTSTKLAQTRILPLLEDLPPESLKIVEQFVRFLHEEAQQGNLVVASTPSANRPSYLYPTIPVAPSSLNQWLDLVPSGYDGDALKDTEALYKEAQ